jgi:hypothetical protein
MIHPPYEKLIGSRKSMPPPGRCLKFPKFLAPGQKQLIKEAKDEMDKYIKSIDKPHVKRKND